MSLPIAWVDKIFTKLTLVYGRDFAARWEGLTIADVKTDWGHELAGFDGHPEAIGFALQNLPPDRPPTVLQFRDLCRKAPAPELPRLPSPVADPARVAAELARLSPVHAAASAAASGVVVVDHKAWAKRLMARHDAGERLNPTTLRFARHALGIPEPVRERDDEEVVAA